MLTYDEAIAKLGKRETKKVVNNTYLHRVENGIAVRLHNTDVVIIHPDGTYTLNAGMYTTVTTKARINKFSPSYIFQKNYQWYIADNVPFKNGVRVDSWGIVVD